MTKKIIGAAVIAALLGSIGVLFWALSNNKVVIGYNQGYEPDQPLPFSHKKHAGDLKLDCRYCHTSVEVSRHASVPALNVCMNCHGPGLVKTNTPNLEKLREAYDSGKSIAWQKVHLLPDFVHFHHGAHINAGKECVECHGPVQEMEKVRQHASLSMGWCVNCHRQPEHNAPDQCSTCHY